MVMMKYKGDDDVVNLGVQPPGADRMDVLLLPARVECARLAVEVSDSPAGTHEQQ